MECGMEQMKNKHSICVLRDFQSLWITSLYSFDLYTKENKHQKISHLRSQDCCHNRDNQHSLSLGPLESGRGLEILETKFTNNTSDNKMDDMVFQHNNKNAIYVLNTSYDTYGEFGHLNLIGYPQITSGDNKMTSAANLHSTANVNSKRNICPVSRSLQQFKTLGNFSSDEVGNSATTSTSCSPAAYAIQKLFNCSSRNNNNNNNNHNSCFLSNNSYSKNNNYCHYSQTTETNEKSSHRSHCSHHHSHLHLGSSAALGDCSRGGNKKKCTAVKSTLIAKKTKFLKYLEEEKWRKLSVENLSTTNCERNRENSSSPLLPIITSFRNNPSINANKPRAFPSVSQQATNSSTSAGMKIHNHHYNNNIAINNPSTGKSTQNNITNNKITNWSENTYKNNHQPQQQQQQRRQKSSTELYKEAAELLGLSCSLCDNCRCLDCQSRYFECDDSDSFSEVSFNGEYYESSTLQAADGDDDGNGDAGELSPVGYYQRHSYLDHECANDNYCEDNDINGADVQLNQQDDINCHDDKAHNSCQQEQHFDSTIGYKLTRSLENFVKSFGNDGLGSIVCAPAACPSDSGVKNQINELENYESLNDLSLKETENETSSTDTNEVK